MGKRQQAKQKQKQQAQAQQAQRERLEKLVAKAPKNDEALADATAPAANDAENSLEAEILSDPSRKDRCTHAKFVVPDQIRKITNVGSLHNCMDCLPFGGKNKAKAARKPTDPKALWICLTCGKICCDTTRHVNLHRLSFTKHPLSINLHTLQIWCHACHKNIELPSSTPTPSPAPQTETSSSSTDPSSSSSSSSSSSTSADSSSTSSSSSADSSSSPVPVEEVGTPVLEGGESVSVEVVTEKLEVLSVETPLVEGEEKKAEEEAEKITKFLKPLIECKEILENHKKRVASGEANKPTQKGKANWKESANRANNNNNNNKTSYKNKTQYEYSTAQSSSSKSGSDWKESEATRNDRTASLVSALLTAHKFYKQLQSPADSTSSSSSSDQPEEVEENNNDVDPIEKVKQLMSTVSLRGLQNLGNTCFFNSTMQNLARCTALVERLAFPEDPEIVKQLMIGAGTREEMTQLVNLHKVIPEGEGKLTAALRQFITDTRQGSETYSPRPLFSAISRFAPRFSSLQQQDAHEVLSTLFNAVQTEEVWRLQALLKPSPAPAPVASDSSSSSSPSSSSSDSVASDSSSSSSPSSSSSDSSAPVASDSSSSSSSSSEGDVASGTEEKKEEKKEEAKHPSVRYHSDPLLGGPKLPLTFIDEIFGGVLESVVTCHGCRSVSRVHEPFLDLLLPLKQFKVKTKTRAAGPNEGIAGGGRKNKKNRGNVQITESELVVEEIAPDPRESDLVDHRANGQWRSLDHEDGLSLRNCFGLFTKPEILADENAYQCAQCTKNHFNLNTDEELDALEERWVSTEATRQLLLHKTPKVMTIGLKRFATDLLPLKGALAHKIDSHVSFPIHLDISDFCVSPNNDDPTDQNTTGPRFYELRGVVVHGGHLSGGHYVAYTRSAPNTWHYFSDTHRSESSQSAVLKSQAYMLFYEASSTPPSSSSF